MRAEALSERMRPWNTLVEIIQDSPDEPRPRVRDLAWPTVPSMHHNSSSIVADRRPSGRAAGEPRRKPELDGSRLGMQPQAVTERHRYCRQDRAGPDRRGHRDRSKHKQAGKDEPAQ